MPTVPKKKKEKKSGKESRRLQELETISEADLTEAEQLKIITKEARQRNSHLNSQRFLVQIKELVLHQVQATQEIEDTHVTLTPVNPDGQQQSSSVSSGFVSNMLNPEQEYRWFDRYFVTTY
ncbi:hypothetical protein Tco_0842372 [Tanacetum coccineum]|uniref:Uncharacterized protein n=1 Tax=Tanacetum coccineum TaxID=301880 RepID=A0ABQ5AZ31_9ASTR